MIARIIEGSGQDVRVWLPLKGIGKSGANGDKYVGGQVLVEYGMDLSGEGVVGSENVVSLVSCIVLL
jgi:hypothetical protein